MTWLTSALWHLGPCLGRLNYKGWEDYNQDGFFTHMAGTWAGLLNQVWDLQVMWPFHVAHASQN